MFIQSFMPSVTIIVAFLFLLFSLVRSKKDKYLNVKLDKKKQILYSLNLDLQDNICSSTSNTLHKNLLLMLMAMW